MPISKSLDGKHPFAGSDNTSERCRNRGDGRQVWWGRGDRRRLAMAFSCRLKSRWNTNLGANPGHPLVRRRCANDFPKLAAPHLCFERSTYLKRQRENSCQGAAVGKSLQKFSSRSQTDNPRAQCCRRPCSARVTQRGRALIMIWRAFPCLPSPMLT